MRVEDMMDHEVNEVRKTFRYFDRNNLGTIATDRLGDCLRWLKLVPSEAEISAFSVAADPEGTGTIDFDTFLAVAAQLWIPDLQQREAQSWAAFLCFDKLDKGKLSVEDMKTILTETSDEPLPEKEVNQIIKKFVDKKDGMIEYGYMIRAWQK
ncbi:putative calmodulin-like protein 6 [Echinococcus granulosus]|uniref:Calmodulin-like protein n=2 Tax=Echinococcus granulosus TaxID=6210 RepID=W6USR2_ECHGR|nr:Putative calmodulin-like protein [Echinococcus granulosus]EUB64660.1 Putative calmodulin-like protein [Echinococcus granulosus]KAH9285559.1 putative calmodulin-like protein 6 [Echinococcus granulosus]